MSIQWKPSLEIGVEKIDQQHKIWFEKADKLFEAGKQGKTKEYIIQLFDYLDEYTKTHFKDEENYMLSINYPDYKIQKQLHDGFIEKLSKLRKDYENSGASISVIINANQFMLDWLIKHISSVDRKIGEYVNNNK
ncbi:bacteriohemerythrin [Sedimentibacter sp. MB31-C6]|uniref:bacteriohemerythrin n=1 Tax=Sedimentibacter sp. MB31-C6 TaxID=3109366 RepID=UPI002DDD70EE|nr:bacteriohemerythrin [Sedimentibacter sp. MB36-C1]WSI04949.1 bacteriohemerythrin [Sedimentibacter sp. MB36-C1]